MNKSIPSLTHQAILDVMEKALESSGWPENDAAIIPHMHSNPKIAAETDDGYISLGRFHSPATFQYIVRG
jgi:hypothetical protein